MPVISTNTAANTAVRFLNSNSSDQSNSLAKLASGSNINKASDDAAGLAISTKIGTDVAALEQASTNASHAVSVLSTADGGASNIADIVERMKTLASQSASGTVTDTERAYIQAEFEELQEEIDGITESTRYNGVSLLDGSSDFSVDDIKTAAEATNDTVASQQSLVGTAGTFEITTATTLSFTIEDGTNTLTVNMGDYVANDEVTAEEIATAINTAAAEAGISTISASSDANGYLYINTVGGDQTITAGGSGDTINSLATSLAASGTAVSDGAFTGYTNADATATETATISVGGSKIELTAEYDGSQTELTTADLVTQINDGLHDDGNYLYEASENAAGEIVITSLATGETANVTLAADSDADSGLSLAALGFAAGTTSGSTTEVETTGAEIVVGSTSADTINLSISSLTCSSLGIDSLDVSTEEGAAEALSVLDNAINQISEARAEMGATMSRFEFRSAQIDTSVENLEAAQSAISDVDIAKEQAELSSSSVKVQAAVAAASQANQMPQNLLSLIQ
ncbi:flagellin [uncultured Cohaesibacter sp.]|uniref:flagellin N-terminal helical domain-containing protein n=1 Tax=uncultured Cohaesibacter sp. TaxID=1002546 RepID=UPI0029315124|nr:flagellin [uncultured Cohaesibacter sp.]